MGKGILALTINDGKMEIKMNLKKLSVGELALVYTQLEIINNKILNEIQRLSVLE